MYLAPPIHVKHTLAFLSHTHTNSHTSLKWSYTKSIGNLTNLQAIYHNKCLCMAFDIEHWEAGRALTSLLLYYEHAALRLFSRSQNKLSSLTEQKNHPLSQPMSHRLLSADCMLKTGHHTYIYSCHSTPWRDEKCSRLEKKTCPVALHSTILLFYCILIE